MRGTRIWACSVLTLTSTATAMAQECALPGPACAPQCQTPLTSPTPPRSAGRFVRGLSPGSTAGESTSLGLRGATLHIPEIRISLPHIEFPSLYKVRHDSSKVFDTTRSPLVYDDVLEYDHVEAPLKQPPLQTTQPQLYSPPACTAPPARCAQSTDEALRALQEQMARLEQLEQELVALRQRQASAAYPAGDQRTWRSTGQPGTPEPRHDVGQTVPAPRPQRYPLEPASYEEEASWDSDVYAPLPARSAARQPNAMGRVSTRETALPQQEVNQPPASRAEFGDWNQAAARRPAVQRPTPVTPDRVESPSQPSALGYSLQDVFR